MLWFLQQCLRGFSNVEVESAVVRCTSAAREVRSTIYMGAMALAPSLLCLLVSYLPLAFNQSETSGFACICSLRVLSLTGANYLHSSGPTL